MLSVTNKALYAECHYGECRGALNTEPGATLTTLLCSTLRMGPFRWRHDTQHNDIQLNTKYIMTLSIMALCIDYCFAGRHFF
jgi:hypothetical protein